MNKEVLNLKIIILGNSGVGKTALINRYTKNKFVPQANVSIGSDFLCKLLTVNDQLLNLQIWDTFGQEKHNALSGAYYRNADCCILVCDLNDKSSSDMLNQWYATLIGSTCEKSAGPIPIVVVGNKIDVDLKKRRVTMDHIMKSFDDNTPCYETSAKDSINVDELFFIVAKKALEQHRNDEAFSSG
ncbi:hypothetical protein INT47_003153 [Mucor saturninus]|uniref:Uncharacterized protein n=1 Tax=Mucor saturninus TaxID=64648 RepID=A0A8H7V2G6_9FUNG|nr:hypothetical protein INT47_003153 [Mucor saturninus]